MPRSLLPATRTIMPHGGPSNGWGLALLTRWQFRPMIRIIREGRDGRGVTHGNHKRAERAGWSQRPLDALAWNPVDVPVTSYWHFIERHCAALLGDFGRYGTSRTHHESEGARCPG